MTYVSVEDIAASWEHYQRLATALDARVPDGLILHAAGPTDEGYRVIEVWESQEAWCRFRVGHAVDHLALVPSVIRTLRPTHVVRGGRA